MSIFRLPDLGEGLHEAEIVAWHVSVGDHVVSGQPLVSVETDKAMVEIPSPQSGHVTGLNGAAGERIAIGAPLVEFDGAEIADTGTLVGELPAEPDAGPPTPQAARPARAGAGRVKAAPAVRAMAQRLGVDLAAVTPTGPGGQVIAGDVERAAAASLGPGARPVVGVRRAMAVNMAHAHAEVAPATVTDDAVVDHLTPESDATVRLIRAVAAGCAAEPALNAWFDGEAMNRIVHDRVDLGIAVDTADGLFVPVLRDVGNRDATALRAGLEAMKADVLARRVPHEDLRGQTITLSNFGTMGGRYAALVVVPPQVAILGAGRIAPAVVAVDGRPDVHRLLPLSLTFDHRAVSGGEAARFLASVIADLERPD